MSTLQKELNAAQSQFRKAQLTVSRIKHHLDRLSEFDDDRTSGLVALRIAKAESLTAELHLKNLTSVFQDSVKKHSNVAILQTKKSPSTLPQRDHFSEALERISPNLRLQLAN